MAGLGGKNWSFQEEVTSSDVNGFLADQVVMRFGGTAARAAGFGGSGEPVLAEGMLSYLDDQNRLELYNGSVWVPVGWADGASIATGQGTSSTSYTDLATVGPQVTVTTGTKAIVAISSGIGRSADGNTGFISVAVSGASSISATDDFSAAASFSRAGFGMRISRTLLITGLTAGSNTFTMKYKVDGGIAPDWYQRSIVVWPLP
jgi:hypothetical protein